MEINIYKFKNIQCFSFPHWFVSIYSDNNEAEIVC